METFKDCHILFSGVIPTNTVVDHESTEIWRMARAFGATCHKDLVDTITHVVASKVSLTMLGYDIALIFSFNDTREEHKK